ncbi:MAG TPA: MFS transporter, partial [Burkholderiaceae bacterium]|nr:MFS transporter [Burkholderiaceae bacterium]
DELVVPSHHADADKPVSDNQFAFLRSTAVWMCLAFFFFSTAAFGILQNYSPAILGNVYGVSLVVATGSLTAYLLGSAAGTITGGFLASRNERNERLIAIALGFSALMALLLASGQIGAALVFPVMALMGFGVGTSGPNRDLLVRRAATSQFGKAAFGRIYGFVYSGLDVGLALSPLAFGPLLDAGKFQAALVAVAVLQIAALATAMRIGHAARGRAVAA